VEADRTAHVPTRAEEAARAQYSWTQIPAWDYYPSGRLRIELEPDPRRDGSPARSRFADGTARHVEDKIGEILDEVTVRGELAQVARLERERLDALYQVARAKAVEAARVQYVDDRWAEIAADQAAAWGEAERLRAYATAMATRVASVADEEWLTWIRTHADRLDPPTRVPASPPDLEVPEWQLHAYLSRWPYERPYGWSSG
jgi:hypothetical protein